MVYYHHILVHVSLLYSFMYSLNSFAKHLNDKCLIWNCINDRCSNWWKRFLGLPHVTYLLPLQRIHCNYLTDGMWFSNGAILFRSHTPSVLHGCWITTEGVGISFGIAGLSIWNEYSLSGILVINRGRGRIQIEWLILRL